MTPPLSTSNGPASASEMKVERSDLLSAIRVAYGRETHTRGVSPAPRGIDLPAALFATALWESGGRIGSSGDAGASRGLFHVHQPTWRETAGAYEAPAVVENDRSSLLSALAYELRYVAPAVDDAIDGLTDALDIVRKRAAAGEVLHLNAARDLPVWFSILWQYGRGEFMRWIASPLAKDLSARGWVAFRKSKGLHVQPDHEKRQRFYEETYLAHIQNPDDLLDSLRSISISHGVDFYSRAARTLGAVASDVERWTKETGKSLLVPWLPDSRDLALGLASLALLAFVGYELATVKTKGGGRVMRPEVKSKIESIASMAVPAFAAKLFLK